MKQPHAQNGRLSPCRPADSPGESVRLRFVVIGLISFLTLVDLFAAQAVLPSLVEVYRVSPATMGFAVNASTIGMTLAGIAVAFLSRRIDRRRGVWMSLALLSIPTSLLALAPDIETFAALRVTQGLFMSSAFTLTMAYLAEHCSAEEASGALAAYITGNVASNLVGRLVSAAVADHLGLPATFYVFAFLNVAGALLAFLTLNRTTPMEAEPGGQSALQAWLAHLRNPALCASFGIGFMVLFAFIGTFSYVNFVLVGEPIALNQMAVGFVYFVFLPSLVTTPLAAGVAVRLGTPPAIWLALGVAGAGLPLLLVPQLSLVLTGLALVGVGTFFAQAAATGFVSRAATTDRGSASGIYLASYYLGGLTGSVVLGQVYDHAGWAACVAGIGLSLVLAALLAVRLKISPAGPGPGPTPAAAHQLRFDGSTSR